MVGQLTCRRIAPPLTGRSLVWISSSSFTEKEDSAFSTAALARACSLPMAEGSFPVHGDKARLGERLGEAIPADVQKHCPEVIYCLRAKALRYMDVLAIIACSVSKHDALHPS